MTKAKSILDYGERELYLHCITQISLTSKWHFFPGPKHKVEF